MKHPNRAVRKKPIAAVKPSSRVRPPLNAAQKRIHQAALRLFAEKRSAEVSVSELADAAGVARGTIYNNLESPEHLFHNVAAQLADEMDERIAASYAGIDDPALRHAIGIRWYVRRAHEEPHWGRFLLYFAMSNEAMRNIWIGPPMQDMARGVAEHRFSVRHEQISSALGVLAGTTLSAVMLVLEGVRTWRDAGSDAAEFTLRALGVSPQEARALATSELPPLVEIS